MENHYTHMDDNNYNPVQIDEASYAEVGNEIGPSETTSYKSGSVQHVSKFICVSAVVVVAVVLEDAIQLILIIVIRSVFKQKNR